MIDRIPTRNNRFENLEFLESKRDNNNESSVVQDSQRRQMIETHRLLFASRINKSISFDIYSLNEYRAKKKPPESKTITVTLDHSREMFVNTRDTSSTTHVILLLLVLSRASQLLRALIARSVVALSLQYA